MTFKSPSPYQDMPRHERIYSLLRGLALLPLIIYPFVFLANMMTLGAGTSSVHSFKSFVVYAFLTVSLSYPLTVIGCLAFNKKRKLIIAAVPLMHLGLALLLLLVWSWME